MTSLPLQTRDVLQLAFADFSKIAAADEVNSTRWEESKNIKV